MLREKQAAITTSFGVITSRDKLATTKWVCESALGYDPAQNNELGAAIFPSGLLAVSGPLGLSTSTDDGCDSPAVPGALKDLWMADVSVDDETGLTGVAVSRGPRASTECDGQLFETKDQGVTWAPVRTKLPAGFCAFTVDTAHTDAKRVYVSGNVVGSDGVHLVAQLLVSDDRGVTWTPHEIPGESRPFIGAMSPVDKDTLWIRTYNPPDSGALLVTRDGGKTFQKIVELTGVALQFFGVTGIAVSPDGSRIAYGSVNEGLFIGDTKLGGVAEKRGDFPVFCLTWNKDALYACSSPNRCGPFFVGASTDEGKTFTSLISTLDVEGDKTTCAPASSVSTTCPALWPAVKAKLRACDAGPAPPPPADAALPATPSITPPPDLACSCDVTRLGRASTTGAFLSLGLALVVLRRLRRRR